MKVYRIDTANGEYYTLTEKELHDQFTNEDIKEFEDDDQTIFYETRYTVRQLNRCRKLRSDEDYCYNFEEEYGFAPGVLDILKQMYGRTQ